MWVAEAGEGREEGEEEAATPQRRRQEAPPLMPHTTAPSPQSNITPLSPSLLPEAPSFISDFALSNEPWAAFPFAGECGTGRFPL